MSGTIYGKTKAVVSVRRGELPTLDSLPDGMIRPKEWRFPGSFFLCSIYRFGKKGLDDCSIGPVAATSITLDQFLSQKVVQISEQRP